MASLIVALVLATPAATATVRADRGSVDPSLAFSATPTYVARRGPAGPIRSGATSSRVCDLQWVTAGHNRYRIHSFHAPKSYFRSRKRCRYGPKTRAAVKRAKYLLGMRSDTINGARAGRDFFQLLQGKRKLPPRYSVRRKARLRAQRRPSAGHYYLAPGITSPRPHVLRFVKRVSAVYGSTLVISSGWRFRLINGNTRSHHLSGDAADIATPTYAMNRAVGQAALVVAGMTPARARGMTSPYDFGWWQGVWNIVFGCASCNGFGNHINHVHAGSSYRSWPFPAR